MTNILEQEISNTITYNKWHGGKLIVWAHEQPYDFWILLDGIHYGVEAKMIRRNNAFPFSRLVPHQEAGLLESKNNKGEGIVIISYRIRRKINTYGIRILDWIKIKEKVFPKKSIPKEYFDKELEGITRLDREIVLMDDKKHSIIKLEDILRRTKRANIRHTTTGELPKDRGSRTTSGNNNTTRASKRKTQSS